MTATTAAQSQRYMGGRFGNREFAVASEENEHQRLGADKEGDKQPAAGSGERRVVRQPDDCDEKESGVYECQRYDAAMR
jgi:hypothetical protein